MQLFSVPIVGKKSKGCSWQEQELDESLPLVYLRGLSALRDESQINVLLILCLIFWQDFSLGKLWKIWKNFVYRGEEIRLFFFYILCYPSKHCVQMCRKKTFYRESQFLALGIENWFKILIWLYYAFTSYVPEYTSSHYLATIWFYKFHISSQITVEISPFIYNLITSCFHTKWDKPEHRKYGIKSCIHGATTDSTYPPAFILDYPNTFIHSTQTQKTSSWLISGQQLSQGWSMRPWENG